MKKACGLESELLGEGQLSERLAHACVQLPYGVKVVGVAGERADAIHGLSASCFGGLAFQERTCYVGGPLPVSGVPRVWSRLPVLLKVAVWKAVATTKWDRRPRERNGDM